MWLTMQLNEQSEQEDRFPVVRRTMRVLPPNTGNGNCVNMFFAVTDKTSKLANLAPAKWRDPSLRFRQTGDKLYYSYTLMMSLDVWWNSVKNLQLSHGQASSETLARIAAQAKSPLVLSPGKRVLHWYSM